MAPSRALAARVAATRAAQAAATAPPRPMAATKPAAAPPAASAKPTTVQVQAPPAPAPAAVPRPPAQTPAAAPSAPSASTPAGTRTTAARTPTPPSFAPPIERRPPAVAPKPPPPPQAAPAARSGNVPPSAGAKPAPEIPVLTVEFEASPEVARVDEEEFSFDLALSAGQIDAVLGNESSDVPVLTEPVDSGDDELSTSDSMIMQFDEETQHKLANLEALANAKALEDISNSMAETLFGDAELDKLAATLALATGKRDDKSDDDEPQHPAKARTAS
jgi:hypothetical protein